MQDAEKKDVSFLRKIFAGIDIDGEERGRRKLFQIFLGMLIVPLILFGVQQIKAGYPQYGIPDLAIAILLALFILLSRKMESAVPLFRVMALVALLLLLYWVITGAVDGYASIWVIAYPPFAFFLMGRREGSLWVLIITAVTLFVFFNPFPQISLYSYSMNFVTRHLGTLFMVILFTYNYEAVREIFRDAMKNEKRKLLEEKNLLAAAIEDTEQANKLLEKEMDERRLAQEELQLHRASLERVVSARTEELQCTNEELREALDRLEQANLDLQQSKDSLSASEERYRIVAENLTDLIWSTDLTPVYTYVSPTIKNMFGYTVEEAMRLPFDNFNTPESYETVMRTIAEQLLIDSGGGADPDRFLIIELDHVKKDGSVFPVEIKVSFIRDENGKPIGIAGITRDITERRKAHNEKENMQYQLSQAQKMEAIGTLVGGLAHDFNNLLGGIIGSFELIKSTSENCKTVSFSDLEDFIKSGIDASKRSAGLIRQLLSLSRKREPVLELVDINESLRHILVISRNSFPKSVNLDFTINNETLPVLAEPLQIEQVLLNLAINASHAMTIMQPEPEDQGGTLTVTADRIKADGKMALLNSGFSSAEYWIRIIIKDTGVGIPEENASKIFEPFFTTKDQSDGTGLGLSISYSIIKQHSGFITVDSHPGQGSEFSIYLPASDMPVITGSKTQPPRLMEQGSGGILIIDDEKFITDVVKGVLNRAGYTVTAANHPDDGLNIYSKSFREFSLVMLDLSMPGKSGLDLFRSLKSINPDIKAILISGMLEDSVRIRAEELGFVDFLHKPFTAAELTSMTDRHIEQRE